MNRKGYMDIGQALTTALFLIILIVPIMYLSGGFRIAESIEYTYNFEDELNNMEERYKVLSYNYLALQDQKVAVCEYKQPSINYFTGVVGLIFGFVGALWLLMIFDKKKILEMMKRIKK